MYDPFWRKPEPLVPRRLRLELSERMAADGTVLRARRRRRGARDRRRGCATAGVESVAVCLLHSYRFPEHEELVGAVLREELPGVDRLALERDPARAARVRALGDDRGQRLRPAADGPIRRRHQARARRGRGRRAADDHAVLGRRDDLGGRDAPPRAGARVGPGRGRRRGARDGAPARVRRTRSPSTWAARPRRRR